MFSTDSAFSIRYPAKYSSPASGPPHSHTTTPKVTPRATQARLAQAASRNPTSWASRWKTKRSRARARPMTPSVAAQAHNGVSTASPSSGVGWRRQVTRPAGSEGQAEGPAQEAHQGDAGAHGGQVGVQEPGGGHLRLPEPRPGAEVDAPEVLHQGVPGVEAARR